ncbi:zinc metalloprotease HtpX [Desulfobacca acetoxidans]|uniref:Protease HtpX homolog n=1 Tax=Desulfobacca acetoxidans (strain ATCC 700848 / DSM 11109 / ASRB2) TaxID=880072 RepID=F2NFK6_DESAR|nr:zinc metalloprotease HtpX [Desulfobacca acetoxidans]AEB10125.1 protease htpX [Desulfobacca acetoxidans DSM 11109]
MTNQIKTVLLLGALTALIIFFGKVLGGTRGMQIALILAAAMNFFSYWFSDRIVLKMYNAQEVTQQEAPDLFAMVADLARQAEVPMPRLYIIPEETPNAFATGRNPEHAAVAVTQGILRLLTPTELKGVLAHEMGHVRNRDILIQSIAATLGGAIMVLADMARFSAIFGGSSQDEEGGSNIFTTLLFTILAPIAAMLIQMAISRSREYIADETGARLCHNPESLARALEKLAYGNERIPMQANPATENMFIVSPFAGGGLMSLFSTHPPIEERIARLRAMRAS